MAIRITCTVPAPLKDGIEEAVRQVLAAEPADLHAYITFAAAAAYESGFAPVTFSMASCRSRAWNGFVR